MSHNVGRAVRILSINVVLRNPMLSVPYDYVIGPLHVHVMVAIPPHVTISRLIQRMKGKSSYRLLAEFPHLRKRFWGRHVWARGYFCRSSGNVTDEVIKAYIAQQSHDSDDVFRIEGEASPSGDTPLGEPSGEGLPPRL